MDIRFGVIEKYFLDRGFGFVKCILPELRSEGLFFHISTIIKTDPELVKSIERNSFSDVFFWFEVEKSSKGYRLKGVINADRVSKMIKAKEKGVIVQKLNELWDDSIVGKSPSWLYFVTKVIQGEDVAESNLLYLTEQQEKIRLEAQRKEEKEKSVLKERLLKLVSTEDFNDEEILEMLDSLNYSKDVDWIIEDKKRDQRLRKELLTLVDNSIIKYSSDEINEMLFELQGANEWLQSTTPVDIISEKEFEYLVKEVSKQGFTRSKQVSDYIINNRLGYKYPHISGYVIMSRGEEQWSFKGGFPSNIYGRLCRKLGLSNENSNARAVGFFSFKETGKY
ncbi:hypothetical protein MMG00_00960 [Ignatzschineria rhizosphaerae]|uniref:CSD domain-containing protein n=1 Tax=Ignatzschineria rhizosphaerae TaxID=2923279 RepID=A0ABY3X602_9GAMM|nr:hypothetical protein [Ignatzschineria rhizosphaerae]UNM96472.1 hypothetical protein MMG00_00960 [Ignatzschineria rhizosphaerae]